MLALREGINSFLTDDRQRMHQIEAGLYNLIVTVTCRISKGLLINGPSGNCVGTAYMSRSTYITSSKG